VETEKTHEIKKKGRLDLPGLRDPVNVLRDEKGMAYIYAKNLPDAEIEPFNILEIGSSPLGLIGSGYSNF
jgi:hypothetical protein